MHWKSSFIILFVLHNRYSLQHRSTRSYDIASSRSSSSKKVDKIIMTSQYNPNDEPDSKDVSNPSTSNVEDVRSKGSLSIQAVQTTYNNMAKQYLDMCKEDMKNESVIGPTHTALRKLLTNVLENPISLATTTSSKPILLDVGCGPGLNIKWLSQQDTYQTLKERVQLIGIDLSTAMIDLAAKEEESTTSSTEIVFQIGNMMELSDFQNDSVIGMFNGCCIQHVDLDGVRATFMEAKRVLQPNGMLVVHFWLGEDAPLPGPDGVPFIGWKAETIRNVIKDIPNLTLKEESQHVYAEFDMPYAFFYIRKT